MKRKYLKATIIIFIVTGIISNSLYSQDDEMKNKAMEGMRAWSKSISTAQFQKLGYKDRAEFDQTELGKPYDVFTIQPEKLVEFDTGGNFENLLMESGSVLYPLISEGRNKSLLWMYKKDNEWKVGRIGSSGLSENLRICEETIEKYREERGVAAGESPRFVRIYQLYLDFFYITGQEEAYIMPMQTIPDLGIKGNAFYSEKEIVPVLQAELRKKMPFRDDEGRIKEY
jgi:hypothetical protein